MKYKKIFNKVESILLKICIISLLFLICLQVLVSHEDLSVFFNNTHEKQLNNSTYNEKGAVILKLDDNTYEDIEILVNGETVGNFDDKQEVSIDVFNNDLIEINGTKYLEKIKIKVVGISTNIKSPKLNTTVTTFKNIELIGKVILK